MDNQLLFDRLAYVDRLVRAGVDEAQARAHADAMTDALRESGATKRDIAGVRQEIQQVRQEIQLVRSEVQIAVRDLTIRLGAMLIVLFGVLAAIRFFIR